MVDPGQTAVIHYTARMAEGADTGEIVDTTDVDVALESGVYEGHRDYEPLSFEVGAGEVLPGLDEAVREMDPGEKRTVELPPEKAYGYHDADQVIRFPRPEIESRSETEAAEGELVTTDTGESGWITAVTEDTVEVDFNHELAGQALECDIHLLAVR